MNKIISPKLMYQSPDFRTVDTFCESFFLSSSNLTINNNGGVNVSGWSKDIYSDGKEYFEADFK